MAEGSHISWTDDTFNPWEGCQKVGPGCDGCYAEARNIRYAEKGATVAPNWGPGAPRRRTSAANWRKPLKWDREQAAARAADPNAPARFVFCASLADVFDNAVDPTWRRDLFDLIRATPNLTWLLLTKRPGNIARLYQDQQWMGVPPDQDTLPIPKLTWPRNAAIGCTVVHQEEADRDIPKLLAAKADLNPAFTFLSMEPLLGPVDLFYPETLWPNGPSRCCSGADCGCLGMPTDYPLIWGVDWVIAGGETDQGQHVARPANPDWFRKIRDQCEYAKVPFHFKQWGEWSADGGQAYATTPRVLFQNGPNVWRLGKAKTGRLLDGIEHNARPEVNHG